MVQNVLIPFYEDPTTDAADYQLLTQLATAYSDIPVYAVLNPSSGPGTAASAAYVAAVKLLKAAGITVVGYINTYVEETKAFVPTETILQQITNWLGWYGIADIFFDNVQTTNVALYQQLSTAVRTNGGTPIGNPGVNVPATFIGIFATNFIFEGPITQSMPVPPAGFPPSNFGVIIYAAPGVFLVSGKTYGWYYTTSNGLPNPYTGIPLLQATLQAIEATQ